MSYFPIIWLITILLGSMEASKASPLLQAPERPCGPPPSEADYATLEQAWEAIQAHASINGYRMVKNGTQPGRARFRFAKGRDYKPQGNPGTYESKRRKTSTQFSGCKFQLAIQRLSNGRWVIKLPNGPGALHNHGWSDPTVFGRGNSSKGIIMIILRTLGSRQSRMSR